MGLALGDWVTAGHSVLVTGPPGSGKSRLACVLAQDACRRGHTVLYQRVLRMQDELRIRHGGGTFGKWLLQLAKTDVLLLDEWGTGAVESATRSDCGDHRRPRGQQRHHRHGPAPHRAMAGMDWRRPYRGRDSRPSHAASPPLHADWRIDPPGRTRPAPEGESQ